LKEGLSECCPQRATAGAAARSSTVARMVENDALDTTREAYDAAALT